MGRNGTKRPDRIFHNFRALKRIKRYILRISEATIAIFTLRLENYETSGREVNHLARETTKEASLETTDGGLKISNEAT